MGSFAANHITTWFAGYDMTGDSNSTSLRMMYEALEATPFQPATNTNPCRRRIAGLETVDLQQAGFWQSGVGQVDPVAFAALGGPSQVVSNSHDGVEGSPAYLYRAQQFTYAPIGGQVGAVTPFRLTAQSARGAGAAAPGAVRGRVLKTKADVSATGATGTPFQLGAAAAGQWLYAGLHVFGAGTTISAVLESAAASNFTGATTRITFAGITAQGGYWGTRLAGPVTDTWYRLRITAITGTFSIACVAGIR